VIWLALVPVGLVALLIWHERNRARRAAFHEARLIAVQERAARERLRPRSEHVAAAPLRPPITTNGRR